MCGIFGILLLNKYNIYDLIINGLLQLENRGYDSSGLCVLKDGKFNIIKSVSSPLRADKDDTLTIGMGHNRWATHGGNTLENAHPHVSNDRAWSIVHNGIIENYNELKLFLIEKGYTFYSQTDTEVICNLLQYNYNGNVYNAIRNTIRSLKGTYALVIMTLHEENLFCVKKQSPLLVGYGSDKYIITSEKSGFCNDVNYIILNDNDICIINENSISTDYEYKEYNHIVKTDCINTYPHWTLKEIYEQPSAVLNIKKRKIDLDVNNIIILGCGTSYHAGLYGMRFFKPAYTVMVFDGAEFTPDDIPKGKSAFIFISQSGETIDLYQCLKITNGPTIGIINVEDSLIAREVDHVIYSCAGKEVGVASMKTFTNQVVCLAILAGLEVDLEKLSHDIQTTIDISLPICKTIQYNDHLFLIGKGTDEVIAKEGALKLKEISYIHAEGFSSSSLKHGPFALLDENMPVVLLDLVGANLMNTYHEVQSRNSPILYITNRENEKANIIIPKNKMFASLLGIIPLQLLAYYISIHKGINPDKPKNLAKVVTVL
jgi:glucosamine--fructose-6-phosphate aminotransferase (isomerizing)